MLCLYMRIVRTKHRFHSLFYMWERASTMFFTLQLWFVMLHTTKLKINKVLNKITRKLHNIRQVCYKKTDLCSWIFRYHWNFEFLYRLTRVKLYHHYEMVSFSCKSWQKYRWKQHCRAIRANMSTCELISQQLQEFVPTKVRISLTLPYCCWTKFNCNRSFVTRSFFLTRNLPVLTVCFPYLIEIWILSY